MATGGRQGGLVHLGSGLSDPPEPPVELGKLPVAEFLEDPDEGAGAACPGVAEVPLRPHLECAELDPEGPCGPRPAGRVERLPRHAERVRHPAGAVGGPERARRRLPERFPRHHEGGRQVPRVDRRDVARPERLARRRVVPVEEVSADALEPVHPVDAPPQPDDEAGRPGEPEVPRRDRAEERHPEVRRRGPGGDLPAGILLEVVRDEPVLCGDLEALVVAPDAAREAPRPLLRELAGRLAETPAAPAHPVGDRGGEGPEE